MLTKEDYMKRYVGKKEEVETTTEIGRFCGFTTTAGKKGYLVYSGTKNLLDPIIHAVLVEPGIVVPNVSCGDVSENSFPSVEYFVNNANKVFAASCVTTRVEDIYFFVTLKEMHRWLSE